MLNRDNVISVAHQLMANNQTDSYGCTVSYVDSIIEKYWFYYLMDSESQLIELIEQIMIIDSEYNNKKHNLIKKYVDLD